MPEDLQQLMTFAVERSGEGAVVKCEGRMVAGATNTFFTEVKDLIAECKEVTIDLAEVTYVDSTGLGVLIRLYTSARKQKCEFRLLHLNKQLRNLLRLTNLLSVFGEAEGHGINIA